MKNEDRVRYDPRLHLKLVKWIARSGGTNKDFARELGIGLNTWTRWRADHPELEAVLRKNRFFIDSMVEDSLLKRALGYRYRERTVVRRPLERTVREAEGELPAETATEMVTVERKTQTKRMPPDVTACMFWLRNRMPEQWKEVLRNDFTGKDEEAVRERKTARKVLSDPQSVKLANDLARRVSGGTGRLARDPRGDGT